MSTLLVLWDESHLWGLLLARALQSLGLQHEFVLGAEIGTRLAGAGKDQPAMLVVPGGNARVKALALGPEGRKAIREYVRKGGHYLGFCGGAGLALSWADPAEHVAKKLATKTAGVAVSASAAAEGLALCPWERGHFDERMQHFMSGHLQMRPALGPPGPEEASAPNLARLVPPNLPKEPLLPVWWPGRFNPRPENGVATLAAYAQPGPDFWLADLPIASLPPHIFATWESLYGFCITPTYLEGQPCLVHGQHGAGSYTLSYSHLETPDSPDANLWLVHIIKELAGLSSQTSHIPAWEMEGELIRWPASPEGDLLEGIESNIAAVAATGLEQGLFFRRNSWLLGWRAGIPGANINSLLTAIRVIRRSPACEASRSFIREHGPQLLQKATLFAGAGQEYLLAERLAQTLGKTLPDVIPPTMLKEQRAALFGPPMRAGGLFHELMTPLDRLAYLQLQNRCCNI